MIVVHKNTAFKNIMQAKDGQDYLGLRPISVVINGEDGNLFEEYEIVADCYLFMARQKGGCGSGHTSFYQRCASSIH